MRRLQQFALGLIGLTLVLPGCGVRSHAEEVCEAATAIASDPRKIAYAKEWIASHLSNERFVESLRRDRELEFRDERAWELGRLDWKYLGFAEELATLAFNLDASDSGGWEVDRINSASLWLGRTAIIINLSSEKHLALSWSPEHLEKIRAVGADVFVFCGDVSAPAGA